MTNGTELSLHTSPCGPLEPVCTCVLSSWCCILALLYWNLKATWIGVVATPEQAQDAHSTIRAWLKKNASTTIFMRTTTLCYYKLFLFYFTCSFSNPLDAYVASSVRIIYGGIRSFSFVNRLHFPQLHSGFVSFDKVPWRVATALVWLSNLT